MTKTNADDVTVVEGNTNDAKRAKKQKSKKKKKKKKSDKKSDKPPVRAPRVSAIINDGINQRFLKYASVRVSSLN